MPTSTQLRDEIQSEQEAYQSATGGLAKLATQVDSTAEHVGTEPERVLSRVDDIENRLTEIDGRTDEYEFPECRRNSIDSVTPPNGFVDEPRPRPKPGDPERDPPPAGTAPVGVPVYTVGRKPLEWRISVRSYVRQ